jgi:hypothetical protein
MEEEISPFFRVCIKIKVEGFSNKRKAIKRRSLLQQVWLGSRVKEASFKGLETRIRLAEVSLFLC